MLAVIKSGFKKGFRGSVYLRLGRRFRAEGCLRSQGLGLEGSCRVKGFRVWGFSGFKVCPM